MSKATPTEWIAYATDYQDLKAKQRNWNIKLKKQ